MNLLTTISGSKPWKLLLLAAGMTLGASAEDVVLTTPGTLAAALGDADVNAIVTLSVEGPISNSDVKLLRQMAGRDEYNDATAGNLQHLDLSKARIVANANDGYYFKTYPKSNTTADDVVGSNMFRGLHLQTLLLPDEIVSVGQSAFMGAEIETLELPDGVTEIASDAFSECRNLTSVRIPASTLTIGGNAFAGCSALTAIALPGVTAVSDGMFSGCSELADVSLSENLTAIGANAFQNCGKLQHLTLPAQTASLGFWCLKGTALATLTCKGLTPPVAQYGTFEGVDVSKCVVNVPKGCAEVYRAAQYWSAFTQIQEEGGDPSHETVRTLILETAGTLASLLTEEEKYLIEDLTIVGPLCGADLDVIRQMAGVDFSWNATPGQLRRLDLSDAALVYNGTYNEYGLRVPDESDYYAYVEATLGGDPIRMAARENALPEMVFTKTKLEEVVMPKSITKIYSAFSGCYNLKGKVVIPEGVTTIGDYAFEGCCNITEVQFPTTLREPEALNPAPNESAICAHAFDGCTSLTFIDIPVQVKNLRDAAFQACTGLVELVLPASIEKIGQKTFADCTGLTRIFAENAVPPSAYYQAFDGVDHYAVVVEVPVGAKAAYRKASEWGDFLHIIEKGEVAEFCISVNKPESVTVTDASGAVLRMAEGDNVIGVASVTFPLTLVPADGFVLTATLDGTTLSNTDEVLVGAGSKLVLELTDEGVGISTVSGEAFGYDAASGTLTLARPAAVYAPSGRLVARYPAGSRRLAISQPGVYFVKVEGAQTEVRKILVK